VNRISILTQSKYKFPTLLWAKKIQFPVGFFCLFDGITNDSYGFHLDVVIQANQDYVVIQANQDFHLSTLERKFCDSANHRFKNALFFKQS